MNDNLLVDEMEKINESDPILTRANDLETVVGGFKGLSRDDVMAKCLSLQDEAREKQGLPTLSRPKPGVDQAADEAPV